MSNQQFSERGLISDSSHIHAVYSIEHFLLHILWQIILIKNCPMSSTITFLMLLLINIVFKKVEAF